MFKLNHPFFAPKIRRVIVTGFTGVWALLELYFGNIGWAAGIGAVAAWAFYEFFIAFDPADYEDKTDR